MSFRIPCLFFAAAAAVIAFESASAKSVGLQYDYVCDSEDGAFRVEVITDEGRRTSAKIDGWAVHPESLRFDPRLGAQSVMLYFINEPGWDEQNNQCELTYTNAQ